VEAIRHLLQYQLAGLMHDERSREEPVRAMIARLLVSGGFSEKTADRVTNRIAGDAQLSQAWRDLARILENNVRVGQDVILKNGGAVALIGPTGVGKTTTIAKLAARFALEYGPDQVALISTDNYRIGASEQLLTYGRIMGCAVKVVEDVTTLSEALYQLRNRSLVLIDTAGLGQRDTRLEEELMELDRNARIKLQHYLVLPGTAQRKVLEDAVRRFGKAGVDGLIITKLDESVSIGDALSISIEQDIPIAYTTSGQRVPEDLEIGDARRLVSMLLSQIEDLEPELELGSEDAGKASWARDLDRGE
jgi:flagellar biosynthesis protein FlhF